jgi:pimeloyl-ACP methyl ester carboxylesterase
VSPATPPPGPVERSVLAELAPTFRARTVSPGPGPGVLRVLEGGEGPPLVVFHGRGSASTMWLPLLPRLARTRRVLAVDLPGFGASGGHRFHGGGFEAALAFFVDPVEAWLAAEGVRAPVLLGHSLGGFVALELALRRKVAPAALALIAPLGVGPEVALAARLFFHLGPERVARAIGPSAFARLFPQGGPDTDRLSPLSYELYAVPGGRPDAKAAFDVLAPVMGPAPHRRARLHEIDVPALILWGDHDEALPSPLALAAAAELPRGMLRMVKAGHGPHVEDPEGALALLAEVLGPG